MSRDASNVCLPEKHPVVHCVPPVPSPVRGERCPFSTECGKRLENAVLYGSNKSVILRNDLLNDHASPPLLSDVAFPSNVLVYRGHAAPVSAVSVAPSSAYAATADTKGYLKIWALDHPDHRAKYETIGLTGPIRDVDWDGESKRICVTGERAPTDQSGACSKVLQWDTGNSLGNLGLHFKGRASSCSMKPNRPYCLVTAGTDDSKLLLHSGPPFQKVAVQDGIPHETAHTKGAVQCVRYSHSGSLVASVGTDRTLCLYDGKTLELLSKSETIHAATIYSVAWSNDDSHLLTASGDGTCKLWKIVDTNKVETSKMWNVAEHQAKGAFTKVPVGGSQVGCGFLQGDKPVSVSLNGQLSILGDTIKTITGHNAPIADCVVDRANSVFYTADTDGIMCKWDLKSVQPIRRLELNNNDDLMYVVHTGAISALSMGNNGSLYSVGWDDKLFVTDKDAVVQDSPQALGAQPVAMASGTKLACIVTVAGLRMVDADGKVGDLVSIPYEANVVAVSKDDANVYVGGKDCKIHVYSVVDGTFLKEKHVITDHLKPIHTLALDNEGRLVAGDERDICVWNLDDYSAVIGPGRWCFHTQRVTCLAIQDDFVASGGADDSIYIWNIHSTMKRVHYNFCHRGGLVALEFLQDRKLLSVGVDSVVQVWDIAADVKAKFG